MATNQVSPTAIDSRIYLPRGQRVMLDVDLARLYGVEVKALNQAVKRNAGRFPADFMMLLEWEEVESLRSQIVTLNAAPSRRGRHAKYRPHAFTEQGVAMLSSVLKSARALESKYDGQFRVVFDAIRELMAPPVPPNRRIGFVSGD